MSKLTLSDFTTRFRDGLEVSRFDLGRTRKEREASRAALSSAADADRDGVIAGPELEAAFRHLDGFDGDGSARTVDTRGSAAAAWRAFQGAARAPGALATDARLTAARLETSVVDWKASALNAAQTEAGRFRSAADRYLDLAGGQSDTGLVDLAGNGVWAMSSSVPLNLAAVGIPAAVKAGAGALSFDRGEAKLALAREVDAQLGAETTRVEGTASDLRRRIQDAARTGDTAALQRLDGEVRALAVRPVASSDAMYRDLLLRHAERNGISVVGDPRLAEARAEGPIVPGHTNLDTGNYYLSTGADWPLTLSGPEIARELSGLDPATRRPVALHTTASDFMVRFPETPVPEVLAAPGA